MTNHKEEKIADLMKSLAADFLQKESNRTALITVTRVIMSDNLKSAKILFTVLPEEKEEQALQFAKRQIRDFRDFVKEKARIRTIPFFSFEIDLGEKNRQKIDALGINT